MIEPTLNHTLIHHTSTTQCQLKHNEVFNLNPAQGLWRLESGALRIDIAGAQGASSLVRMVLPGDLVGVEHLVGVADELIIRAITNASLVAVPMPQEAQMKQILMDAVTIGYQRTRELVLFRSGSTDERVKHMLLALNQAKTSAHNASPSFTLPSLKDIASIINAAPETVCRALASLRKSNFMTELGFKHVKLDASMV